MPPRAVDPSAAISAITSDPTVEIANVSPANNLKLDPKYLYIFIFILPFGFSSLRIGAHALRIDHLYSLLSVRANT